MSLLEKPLLHAKIWLAYTQLGEEDNAKRARAMATLRDAGEACLVCLRFASANNDSPRVQFAAAVVLHWLGQKQGMEVLTEAIRWRADNPAVIKEAEEALAAIGSPDATAALLALWWQLPEGADQREALACICRVWARLRDPHALDGLIGRATRIPELFLETIPAFGEMAVMPLTRMLRLPDPQRRRLAVEALGGIEGRRAFAALTPLLGDPDPFVRAAAPDALIRCGGYDAARPALIAALEAGYASAEAVERLAHIGPPPFDVFLRLVARYDPQADPSTGHSPGALMAALSALAGAAWPNSILLPPLCELIRKKPEPAVMTEAARVLGARGPGGDATDALARETLWPLLAHSDTGVRAETAGALAAFGEPLGRQMTTLLDECRPQESLRNRLHSLLRGGPDAGQVATQAVQQVTQWVSKVSKETVERWNAPTGGNGAFSDRSGSDPRLPELLRALLANALSDLQHSALPEKTEALLALCVSVLRALGRIGAPAALCAREELHRALQVVKFGMAAVGLSAQAFRKSETREAGEVMRAAAAETLLLLYGPSAFPVFLEALYSPQPEARGTAIDALGKLGDVRALPHLQPIAARAEHPFSANAQAAIALIRRTHPEIMTLLRASAPGEAQPGTLLRPAFGNPEEARPDILLRPASRSGQQPAADQP